MRVLIVIAHPCRMGEVAQALGNAGLEVDVVWGWCRALEFVQLNQPSLLLVCSAPEAGPTRILRRVTRAPILALLVDAGESDIIDILTAGADDCQPASIEPREVLVRARSLLRRAGWRQRPATALLPRAP